MFKVKSALLLAVIGILSMLALVVLIQQKLVDGSLISQYLGYERPSWPPPQGPPQ